MVNGLYEKNCWLNFDISRCSMEKRWLIGYFILDIKIAQQMNVVTVCMQVFLDRESRRSKSYFSFSAFCNFFLCLKMIPTHLVVVVCSCTHSKKGKKNAKKHNKYVGLNFGQLGEGYWRAVWSIINRFPQPATVLFNCWERKIKTFFKGQQQKFLFQLYKMGNNFQAETAREHK